MKHAKHPLFPRTVDAQVADLNTKIDYLQQNAARLGIPATEITTLAVLVRNTVNAWTVAGNREMRTKIDVAVRNGAIRAAQKAMRRSINFYVMSNPDAVATDFEALNIPQPKHHLPLSRPQYVPGIGHITSTDLAVIIPFFDAQTGRQGKPDGVLAIEACYRLGGELPADISDMTGRTVHTASPMRLRFDAPDELQVLYLAFRWIGTHGEYGPWSKIYRISIAR
jgi:hypothetical protein